ncbi:MAG TPA: ABC transporter permease [Spirochaetota bacterium]|nr:ABC transporter permease [Spirochaetota bacterium]HPJ35361.1 ABC transporter permease [Spirochaetota bacterium]
MRLFEFFIGFRYLKSKKSQGFISFNTFLSILIVFLGVFILIVVISVMNGFQGQIKDKILDVDSHIVISNLASEIDGVAISDYRDVTEKILKEKHVVSANPYLQGQGLFRFRRNVGPIMIRGIGTSDNVPSDIKKFITLNRGDYCKKKGIYVGEEMAFNYGIRVGSVMEVIVPQGRLTAIEGVTPGIKKYKVLGFFKTGYYDFDTKLIIMSLTDAQRLFSVGDVAYAVGVKIDDIYKMDRIASALQSVVGFEYVTMTAEQRNHNLFYALRLEKLIMTVILFLVIISAGFTIMGTIVMVVMEKRKAIGILKSMGAKPRSIMIIFVLEGFLIGVTGSILGVIFGLAASLNLETIILWIEDAINAFMIWFYHVFNLGEFYRITLKPSSVYYIDTIPTEIVPEFVVFIAAAAVFLATIAAIFPSWQASRQKPVETIRYE